MTATDHPPPASAPDTGAAVTATTGTLAAHGLACRRGTRLLFRGLTLALPPGHIGWLRGTNGSGKTSLLRILAGLSTPAEGQLTWNGEPLRRGQPAAAAARRGIVYLGHSNALNDDLTLAEALLFLARLQGVADAPQRVADALARLGVTSRAGAAVRTLSQGQRRRGALARLALDDTPRTWLLDEPYDALDAAGSATLSALIEANAARGGAVLLTSHQTPTLAGALPIDLGQWRAG